MADVKFNKYPIVVAAVLVLATLAAWSYLKLRQSKPRLVVNTCLQDAEGLRSGARVRIAGVDVGFARVVRAQPLDRACPVAVELAFTTNYELKIPADSVVLPATEGILGETLLDIDVSQASGSPIANGGLLQSRPREKLSAEKIRELLQKPAPQDVTPPSGSSPHRKKEQ
jgi:ABC-type transporter Mla subunit MlaD